MAAATRFVSSILVSIRRTIEKCQFLEHDSRAVIGISGGVDSLVLLFLLVEYNARFKQNWEIYPCHVDPRFPGWDTAFIEDYCKSLGAPCTIVQADVMASSNGHVKRCFLCARERRRKLLKFADSLDVFQIALAHHLEDVVETFILNMIYNGVISAFVPRQSVIRGRFYFVRPLYYIRKRTILSLARAVGIPENKNICPYATASRRERVRDFLKGVERDCPETYASIFKGMLNVKNQYLP